MIILKKKERLLIAYVEEKKKKWLNYKIKQIGEANRRNETWKFYKDSTFLIKKQTQIIPLCKDNNGKIISERISILENWKQYFNNIQNFETQQTRRNTKSSPARS
jgi:hypothetical protein